MSGEEEQGRRVRNMQDLLRFCIEGTVREDVQRNSNDGRMEMDPERRAWLDNAIKAFTVDIVQEMLQALANIKRGLENLRQGSSDQNRDQDAIVESMVSSLDILLERTEDLDVAADFEKIGGFTILQPLLESSRYSDLQVKGAELVGELVQNHPFCQKAALNHGILNVLTKNLDTGADAVKVKTLYAISCMIRANTDSQDVFVNQLDGFSVLLRAMQLTSEEGPKLRTKSAFILSTLLHDRPDFKKVLLDMGFIEQLVGLLHQEHDQSHEHLLSSLLNFITDFQPALQESLRPELQLKLLLLQKIQVVHGKPEYEEEEGYCNSILQLLHKAETSESVPEGNTDR